VVFDLLKGCKSKDYVDVNASMAWDRLRNKFELSSALSLVKIEKQFRQCSLKKGQDPVIWITEHEDNRMRHLKSWDQVFLIIHVFYTYSTT
jgi:hypothetical protein